MYKGIQKRAVVLRPGANSIIEEAYFILKDDFSSIKESEMIREANKILKNNIVAGYFFEAEKTPTPPKKNGMVSFLAGGLLSFVLSTVLFLLIK
ncbi:MAG: hypothetical protein IJN17_09270 [Clostridia bacterium]|nr:hypothetical protein [Clostridia bacterium]